MQTKAKVIIIILAAVAAVCAIAAAVLWANRDKHILDGPGMVYEEDKSYVEEVTDLGALIGKIPSETGYEKEQFSESVGYTVFKFTGKLFGSDAYGSVYFSGKERNGENEANAVYISCKEMDFSDCRDSLTVLYGEPTGEGEEPYVEVNGGAVTWCSFETEELKIRLSMGSKHNYFDITISANKD